MDGSITARGGHKCRRPICLVSLICRDLKSTALWPLSSQRETLSIVYTTMKTVLSHSSLYSVIPPFNPYPTPLTPTPLTPTHTHTYTKCVFVYVRVCVSAPLHVCLCMCACVCVSAQLPVCVCHYTPIHLMDSDSKPILEVHLQ